MKPTFHTAGLHRLNEFYTWIEKLDTFVQKCHLRKQPILKSKQARAGNPRYRVNIECQTPVRLKTINLQALNASPRLTSRRKWALLKAVTGRSPETDAELTACRRSAEQCFRPIVSSCRSGNVKLNTGAGLKHLLSHQLWIPGSQLKTNTDARRKRLHASPRPALMSLKCRAAVACVCARAPVCVGVCVCVWPLLRSTQQIGF